MAVVRLYYLTFRRTLDAPQVTLFTEATPVAAYRELKRAGLYAAYGREGEAPTRDTHPSEPWDSDAMEGKASGVKS